MKSMTVGSIATRKMNHFANCTSSFLIFRLSVVLLFYSVVIELLRFNLLLFVNALENISTYPSRTVIVSCTCFALAANNMIWVLHQIGILSGQRALPGEWMSLPFHANFHLTQSSEGSMKGLAIGVLARARKGHLTGPCLFRTILPIKCN